MVTINNSLRLRKVLIKTASYHHAPLRLTFSNISAMTHCVKSVQMRNYFWSAFSCIRTEYGDLQSI